MSDVAVKGLKTKSDYVFSHPFVCAMKVNECVPFRLHTGNPVNKLYRHVVIKIKLVSRANIK